MVGTAKAIRKGSRTVKTDETVKARKTVKTVKAAKPLKESLEDTPSDSVMNSSSVMPKQYALPERLEDYDHDEMIKSQIQFKTKQSETIRPEIILEALGEINRSDAVLRFMKYVPVDLARKIECGLFEFSLIKLSEDENYTIEFLHAIYQEKARDLMLNLDPTNRIQNETLRPSVTNGQIQAYYLAFMRPEQLHPKRWKDVIDKKVKLEEYGSEMKVTDLYTCYKCRNKKCITTQQQTRSADEPMTVFVTCLVCYNTFTK